MSNALSKVNAKRTEQRTQAKPGQVKNNAGGFVFKVSEWDRLERFLILGVDGGSYYVKQADLTQQNVDFIKELLAKDAQEVIRRTVAVSDAARAKSNSPAIFVLALAMQLEINNKEFIKEAVLKVCRTSTHLFEYIGYLKNLGGDGRAKRDSIARWYTNKTPQQLAVQAVKYRSRKVGEKQVVTHADAMRISHLKGLENEVGNFILGKPHGVVPRIIDGFEQAKVAKTEKEIVGLISEYNLPWEAVPTEWHKSLKVWRAAFDAGMGQTALVRNVTRFAKLGAFNDLKFAAAYAERLADADRIVKGRMHPFNYLNAALVFEIGQIDRKRCDGYNVPRTKDWETNAKVFSALQEGFNLSFKTVEPANKSTLIALDTSGSMTWYAVAGMEMTCLEASAAFAMFIARTEPYSLISGFSTRPVDIGITEQDSFATALRKVRRASGGGTDLALPMEWARKEKREFETFISITDNETWAGRINPFQALKAYRQETGIDARSVVMGTVATPFTIADSSDKGMLDVVGFDSNVPRIIADFSAGRL